jgi:hypothetical protein
VLANNEVVDIGGKRIRYIDTPQFRMVGMLVSSSRRQQARSFVEICSPRSAIGLH